jgi:uncharacterized membrane protein (DUF2068 family)
MAPPQRPASCHEEQDFRDDARHRHLRGVKGAMVLLAGFGALAFLHRDLQVIADHIVRHSHLDPASRYPRIFLDAAAATNDTRILGLAAGAAAYSAVRFIEAYGLWYARPWAELFAAASGAMYMPFEIYSWLHRHHWHSRSRSC